MGVIADTERAFKAASAVVSAVLTLLVLLAATLPTGSALSAVCAMLWLEPLGGDAVPPITMIYSTDGIGSAD